MDIWWERCIAFVVGFIAVTILALTVLGPQIKRVEAEMKRVAAEKRRLEIKLDKWRKEGATDGE